ncbi:DUF3795 domain-containing protein [Chloroflexota bacterium]
MRQETRYNKLVGICGLYCGTCPSYLAYQENDIEELERISQRLGIAVSEVRCDGCLSDKVMPHCVDCRWGFRGCSRDKEVTWCFQCPDFPCQRLRDFLDVHIIDGISHHALVIEDLQHMKEHGIQDWVEKQEKAGHCPHCGKRLYWFTIECSNCHTKIRRNLA